jgi:hypothetical protein
VLARVVAEQTVLGHVVAGAAERVL